MKKIRHVVLLAFVLSAAAGTATAAEEAASGGNFAQKLAACAACHGENGDGQSLATVSTASEPAVFADFDYMLHMRSDVLYAKIRRGGMGTDMPNFGTLFTPEETWALVDYLWQLSLEEE